MTICTNVSCGLLLASAIAILVLNTIGTHSRLGVGTSEQWRSRDRKDKMTIMLKYKQYQLCTRAEFECSHNLVQLEQTVRRQKYLNITCERLYILQSNAAQKANSVMAEQ